MRQIITTAILFLLIFKFNNTLSQSNHIHLFSNVIIDTSNFKLFDNYKKYPKVLLSDNEKMKIFSALNKDIIDTSNYRFGYPIKGSEITVLNNNSNYININDGYIDFLESGSYKPQIENDSIYHISRNVKQNEEGNTIYNRYKMEYSYLKTKESLSNSVKSILTSEKWNYNRGKFEKTNNTISLDVLEYDNDMEIKGVSSIFTRVIDKRSEKGKIIKQNVSYSFLFYPFYDEKYYNENFDDDSYIKKMNYLDNDLSEQEINSLITKLFRDLYNGNIKAFDPNNIQLTNKDLDSVFSKKTQIYSETDDEGEPVFNTETGKVKTHLIDYPYKINDIIGINFTENWYLATNQFDIIKEVKSIIFLVNDYNEDGKIIGTKKLPCSIKFNN